MPAPRITVGMPLYKGADLVAKALDCLQQQTFGDFEVIISVDGNDVESAAACRPYLADPRFRMVVHRERLDWAGNFNWLLQQDLKEFFCYRQHDDTTVPEFFEVLLRVADQEPRAAAIYCDCQMHGGRSNIEIVPSIKGEPLDRMFQYIARLPDLGPPVPARGLVRTAAIRQVGLVRTDEFRAAWQIIGWLASLLRWGDFSRVAEPLYHRLDRAGSYTREHWGGVHQAAWTTKFTGLLDAAMRLCRTPEERLFFQSAIIDRLVAYPPVQARNESDFAGKLIAECLERLKYEGNAHLLSTNELPLVVDGLQRRVEQIKQSTQSPLRRAAFQVRQQYRLAKLIYPKSRMRRISYIMPQLRELAGQMRQRVLGKLRKLLLPK